MAIYQGTLATIRRQVAVKLRLDPDLDTADANVWINLAYLDSVQRTEALQKLIGLPLSEGVESVAVPEGVLVIKRLQMLYPDETISRAMREVTLENMLALRQSDSAVPVTSYDPLYTRMGQSQIELWPAPQDGQTLQVYHVYAPEALVLDTDEPLFAEPFGSKLLEFGACVEGARFKKDPLLSDYEQAYEYWIGRYTSMLNRSNIIHQFPILESGGQIPSDPSADWAFNWR